MSTQPHAKVAYRLPTHVRPIAYDIDLSTDPSRSDFSGTVDMLLDIQRDTPAIEMHARDLRFTEAVLHRDGQPDAPLSITLHPERQGVSFTAPAPIASGRARLRVGFSGTTNPSMHGLYLASDGHERAICTQCEATDARGIFPCFDEPEFKASLRWTLRTGPGVIALSNGVLDHSEPVPGGQAYFFKPTRPVSSYLAALVVGDFKSSPETAVNGVPLRVYAPSGKEGQTGFAHAFTARLLPWYEEYFAYPYPYGKYDQVAVPGFDAGAMENIGLVLFRKNLLLMDPATTSWRQEKLIAKVIAHEFAHMWFGNLVTMRWWDDLWLNEAFAEWMAHKATHALQPDYRVWDDFQDDKNRALVDDALPTTHPIWTAVSTPEEAIEMFDAITYQKGCAVMRMLENFLGEAAFREGLRRYMKAFAENNATGPDLWSKLAEASGLPVGEVMQSWVTQSGFPVLDYRVEPGKLRVRQRRFFSSPADAAAPSEQRWQVPVVVRYADDQGIKEHRFILSQREDAVALPSQGAVRWCYANAGEVGFYRISPDAAARQALLEQGADQLSAVEKMGFIEDQWALVRNGSGSIVPFIEVLARFSQAPDHNVLRAVVDRLGTLDLLLKDSGDRPARQRFRGWVARLLGPQLQALGYTVKPGEEQNDIQRRALLIAALANIAHEPGAIAESERFAESERRDPRAVDANLAGIFVAVAAKYGDEHRFDRYVDTYRARKEGGATPQEAHRYLYALSAFRRTGLVDRTLQHLEDGTIPQESIGMVFGQLLGQRHAQDQAWARLKAGWINLRERIGDMGLSRLVEAVGHLRPIHREDIVRFFHDNPPRGADRALSRALAAMDQREELRQRVSPDLLAYFQKQ